MLAFVQGSFGWGKVLIGKALKWVEGGGDRYRKMEAIRDLLLAGKFFSISFPASVLSSASDWTQE